MSGTPARHRGGRIGLVCRQRRVACRSRRRRQQPVSDRIFAQGRAGMRADCGRAADRRREQVSSEHPGSGARRRQRSTETSQHGQERLVRTAEEAEPSPDRRRLALGRTLPCPQTHFALPEVAQQRPGTSAAFSAVLSAPCARAAETNENWMEANRYLNMDDLREHKKLELRRPHDQLHGRPNSQNLTHTTTTACV